MAGVPRCCPRTHTKQCAATLPGTAQRSMSCKQRPRDHETPHELSPVSAHHQKYSPVAASQTCSQLGAASGV
jgi:hypothetical protein